MRKLCHDPRAAASPVLVPVGNTVPRGWSTQECPISAFTDEFPLGFFSEWGIWVGGHPWPDTSYLVLFKVLTSIYTPS